MRKQTDKSSLCKITLDDFEWPQMGSWLHITGAAHIANGMSESDAAAHTYLANLKPEQRAIVEA